jgi:L-threonylcarbamoyladenylate synthase
LADGDLILDGGACDVGVESTIIDCTGDVPKILRPGAITAQMITESTGLHVGGKFTYSKDDLAGITINDEAVDGPQIRFSGSLDSHYAPVATVVLDQSPVAGQGFIAMADVATPDGVMRLAAPKNNDEFARVLYAALRAADEQGLNSVVVAQPAGDGIAVAIRDRLKRAAFGSTHS